MGDRRSCVEGAGAVGAAPVVLVVVRGVEGTDVLAASGTVLAVEGAGGRMVVVDDVADAGALAAQLGGAPWCVSARAYRAVAVAEGVAADNLARRAEAAVTVWDLGFGRVRYLLYPLTSPEP